MRLTKNEFYTVKNLARLMEQIRCAIKKSVRKIRRDIAKVRPYYAKGWRTKITLKRRITK